MKANQIQKLLRAVRRMSGYSSFHEWEAAGDNDPNNPNAPFKPQSFSEVGGPGGQEYEDRADRWDGSLMDWGSALKEARVNHVIDFYITKVGDELLTNVEVWIKSERQAVYTECGVNPKTITI